MIYNIEIVYVLMICIMFYSSIIELKHANSKSKIVVTNNLNCINLFFGKLQKLNLEMNPICFVVEEML